MEQNISLDDRGTFYQAKATEQCKKPVMPGDYFFRGAKYPSLFIKISEGKIPEKEIAQYIGKSVEIEFELKTGAWRKSNTNLTANQKYIVLLCIRENTEQ